MEIVCHEAMDNMDDVKERLLAIISMHPEIAEVVNKNASAFVIANNALEDILSAIWDLDE